MERGMSGNMFPGFFEKANQLNMNKRLDSTVSKTFKMFISHLTKIAQSFVSDYPDAADLSTEYSIDEFNNSLTPHAGKFCIVTLFVHILYRCNIFVVFLNKNCSVWNSTFYHMIHFMFCITHKFSTFVIF